MTGGADISEDGLYRYRLWRDFGSIGQRALFIMLNPSTADATTDDPTIRKCCGFATKWGFTGIEVVNLFAFRATNPQDLIDSYEADIDVVGPLNDRAIYDAARNRPVVAAWGALQWEQAEGRVAFVKRIIDRPMRCLRVTRTGSPGHPLYVPYSAQLQPWPSPPQDGG